MGEKTIPPETEDQKFPPSERLTYEEFLAWCDEDTWAEWVEGEVIMVSPASTRHQLLKKFLVTILDVYVHEKGLGEVIDAPFQMKTGPDLPGREPDLLFIAAAHTDRLRESYLAGPADLVVEIVSPESIARDRGEKFVEYERGGVLEYWLIDPERQQAEFYRLSPAGRYILVGGGSTGRYESQVVTGFWLEIDWLWQEPLPKVLQVLQRLGVV
ncbi:MAG: Uma2 family endonuclease [Nitrospinota bacterium]|nr:MAG: Uma2 family endonuclease [Nitrospinota bacterium]